FFASVADRFDNLIEAVNIVGSVFYGTTLGIFVVAFFFKRIGGKAVFAAAILSELIVVALFFLNQHGISPLTYLWLVPVGCFLVIIFGSIFQLFVDEKPLPLVDLIDIEE
ncbi:MAG: SSS family solute:Na+ symporter, partial [Limisphaerales bacterium]